MPIIGTGGGPKGSWGKGIWTQPQWAGGNGGIAGVNAAAVGAQQTPGTQQAPSGQQGPSGQQAPTGQHTPTDALASAGQPGLAGQHGEALVE
jgi:hypothetical protein